MRNGSRLLDDIFIKMGFKSMNDWYRIKQKDIITNGGSSLLKEYKQSPSKMLINIYPQHEWKLWKFDSIPKGYWDDPLNRNDFLSNLFKSLQLSEMDDWYNISSKDIINYGGSSLLYYYDNSLFKMLQSN